jgi:hypothetical protein
MFLNDLNGHGCYFKKCYYFSFWIIHVQSLINLPKSMWNFIFNVTDVIFWIGSLKKETHKIHKNNAPFKNFKKYVFGTKKLKKNKIVTHMDLWKYCQILNIKKSLTIKWLRISKKSFFKWIYHFILHYILNFNNKHGMWINISFFIFDVFVR